MDIKEQANFIWSIADLLRGNFKQSEYGKVILPFTVLRRFDCVLAPNLNFFLKDILTSPSFLDIIILVVS